MKKLSPLFSRAWASSVSRSGLATLLSLSLGACSSTTLIRASDPEVKIYVDDDYRGKGSVSHSDTKIIGSTTQVRLEKAGCETKNYNFSRNEAFDLGACVGGVFLLVPFLWIQKYQPEHSYEFNCSPTHSLGENSDRAEILTGSTRSNSVEPVSPNKKKKRN